MSMQGLIAQLGERCVRNAEVRGSIPLGSTKSNVKNGYHEIKSRYPFCIPVVILDKITLVSKGLLWIT
jgi:hypothetical protein